MPEREELLMELSPRPPVDARKLEDTVFPRKEGLMLSILTRTVDFVADEVDEFEDVDKR